MIGTKLAHYTITNKLGEGGMGVVYEALDSHLDRAVALKLLPHDAVADPSRKQRFVREAKAASALNHPHIVTIYDIDSADGVDFMALELIRGTTLEDLLARGKLRLSDTLKYGVQIADALSAAHAAGIVHRDLKPGNIMITERGDVKVLDFGLAKLTSVEDSSEISDQDATRTQHAMTQEGSIVGSAPYMSPEQVEGRKVDARSDIFSFGIVLYEMLTGKRPFQGASRMATMAAILREEPEPISKLAPEVPAEVERVVSRCLRKELDRRSQSMAEIRVALQDLRDESASGAFTAQSATVQPTPVAITPPTDVPRRPRSRGIYWAAAGLAIAALGTGVSRFLPEKKSAPAPLHSTVLTSYVGSHGTPGLSPDGNQFAFAWTGDKPGGLHGIYISLVGKGSPLRLTPENDAAVDPSWSPDGQSIAYRRFLGKSADHSDLVVIPALGGPARAIPGARPHEHIAWSPDSKWLVWSQTVGTHPRNAIHSALAAGSAPQQLLELPGDGFGDIEPALSPDGRQLAFARYLEDFDADIFTVGFADGKLTGVPKQLTHDHVPKRSLCWIAGGKAIAYIAGDSTSETSVYRVNAVGGEPERVDGIGLNAEEMTVALKGDRMLYATAYRNVDIHRVELGKPGAKPEQFLSSTRYESSATYSPDGKHIAFSSNRSGGVRQIWIADADGTNPTALTSFAQGVAGSPKWSPDSQFIVFDARPGSNADIYTVPAAGGPVKRLTDHPGQDHVPTWSPDGKWIYFGSTRAGGHEIFRMHPDGAGVEQITHNGGYFGAVAPNGKLYYSIRQNGIWKMPADGGKPEQFVPKEAICNTFALSIGSKGIYAVGCDQPTGYPVRFYPYDGGKPSPIYTIERAPDIFPDVSPDGHWLLYASGGDITREILLVENFR